MEGAFRIGSTDQLGFGKETSWRFNATIHGVAAKQKGTKGVVGKNLDEMEYVFPTTSPVPLARRQPAIVYRRPSYRASPRRAGRRGNGNLGRLV
jgi:hypothetical protein